MSSNVDVPIGTILMWSGEENTVPANWMICDGRSLSQNEYKDLSDILGENYGAKPEPGQFYIPDLQGQFIRGYDKNGTRDPDKKSRTDMRIPQVPYDGVGSIQSYALQNHTHQYYHLKNRGSVAAGNYWIDGEDSTGNPQNCNTSSETRPTNVYLNFIIKVK